MSDEPRNPTQEQLHQIALDAWIANPHNLDGARDAVYRAVSEDAALLWELFAEFRQKAVTNLLYRALPTPPARVVPIKPPSMSSAGRVAATAEDMAQKVRDVLLSQKRFLIEEVPIAIPAELLKQDRPKPGTRTIAIELDAGAASWKGKTDQ